MAESITSSSPVGHGEIKLDVEEDEEIIEKENKIRKKFIIQLIISALLIIVCTVLLILNFSQLNVTDIYLTIIASVVALHLPAPKAYD